MRKNDKGKLLNNEKWNKHKKKNVYNVKLKHASFVKKKSAKSKKMNVSNVKMKHV